MQYNIFYEVYRNLTFNENLVTLGISKSYLNTI